MISRFLLLACLLLPAVTVRGDDDSALPGDGFAASHYSELWSKSPFAVASPTDSPTADSPDYTLVGVARFDGICYASLVDKKTQEHFLVSSEKEVRGLTIVSVTNGKDASSTTVNLQKDGQSIVLKLEPATINPAMLPTAPSMTGIPPNHLPGSVPTMGLPFRRPPGSGPPPAIRRTRIIRIPPNPQGQPGSPPPSPGQVPPPPPIQ